MYRQEALESRIKGFSNPVTIKGSLAVHILLAGIVMVSAGLISFGLLTDYTRRANVNGFLSPETGSVSVNAARNGQLFIEAPSGAEVVAGDKLARIVGYDVDASGQSLLELEIQGLQEAQALLGERLALDRSRREPLRKQEALALSQQQRDIISANRLIASRRAQLEIVNEEMIRSENLATRGLIANAALHDVQQRKIAAEQALDEAKAHLETLETETEQLKIDLRLQGVELRQTINALERDLRTLNGQLIQAQARQESGIFAPVGGTITYSAAQNGEAVTEGTQLFQITPAHNELRATLLAPSSAVGFVDVGDVVQIRYSAFPYREHGVFTGPVLAIDDVAQLPSVIRAPLQVSEPVYRVVVEIEQIPESKSGVPLRLASGMTLEASIIIDRKPLLLWLFDPLF